MYMVQGKAIGYLISRQEKKKKRSRHALNQMPRLKE